MKIAKETANAGEAVKVQKLYGAVLEAALDCIIIMDDAGLVVEFNPAAERTFGFSRQEVMGCSLAELIVPPSLRDQHIEGLARYLVTGQGAVLGKRIEIEALHADGHEFPVELAIAPLEIDGHAHFVGYLRDITQRKLAEKETERLLALEQAARAEADAANRSKDDFLSLVSHELRTPLTPMLGWANLLRSGSLDEKHTREAVDAIAECVQNQSQLIDELLDASSIVNGKMTLSVSVCDLAPLLLDSLDMVASSAQAKHISLKSSITPDIGQIQVDAFRLRQTLLHLLSNSIKFSYPGAQIEVLAERNESDVEIQVRDSGQGIAPDLLPHVFDPLLQADSSLTRQIGGLGIGLTLVRHIVNLHGGNVQVNSAGVGQGTTVTVRLPLQVDPAF